MVIKSSCSGPKKLLRAISTIVGAGAFMAPLVWSLPANAEKGAIEEIFVSIGSRVPGRSADDLPVPVDTLNSDSLSKTGHSEVGRMLQSLAPSFNFSSSSISDGTDALRPATLRGLGPDQTLVLVNGKRRHTSALIHVNTSVGRGTAGTDLNAIPAASIKRIEILRDGAAAQYGSDAIAGVINIVLNDADEGGSISLSRGEYSRGDGETTVIDLTKGFQFGEGGYLNTTFNYRDRGSTNRAGLSGQCQYLAGCTDGPDADTIPEAGDPREATFNRKNFRIGDAESEQFAATLNGGWEFDKGELYGFVTYSARDNQSAGFYRRANATGDNPTLADGDAFAPDGFLPQINTEIDDLSIGIGYKTVFDNDMTMDISYTYGQNDFAFNISNSVNASFVNQQLLGVGLSDAEIRATTARSADAGELSLGLQTINLNFNMPVGAVSLAWGIELREDQYELKAGEEYSYFDYDTDATGASLFAADGDAGIQVFPGFQPIIEVDEDRDVYSAYIDAEYDLTEDWLISAAVRYDDYDDFGDTTNYKVATSYDLTDSVTLRSAYSTGFRAPSMQQLYFNNISTQFVSDGLGGLVAQERGTFRNDSALARAVGIPELKEEESTNVSAGIVLQPTDAWSITLDYYTIDIDDRIVLSGGLTAALDPGGPLDLGLAAAGASSGQFFLNGADTETEGWDLVTSYEVDIEKGDLSVSLAANKTNTSVTSLFTTGGLATLEPSVVFSAQDISIIEDWQPEERFNATFDYSLGGLSAVMSVNRYGSYSVCEGSCGPATTQNFSAKILTDLQVAYDFGNNLTIKAGGNNIFDEKPDTNRVGQSRAGTIEDAAGNIIVDSDGVFQFSRRSAPFGFNGAYFYVGASYDF